MADSQSGQAVANSKWLTVSPVEYKRTIVENCWLNDILLESVA
jgi:hypothetical protein